MSQRRPIILIRGGGDLATGVAARLSRSGFHVVITEIAQPRTVRRLVAFAEAVYEGQVEVEDLSCQLVTSAGDAMAALDNRRIPIIVDPDAQIRKQLELVALVDARMRKAPPEIGMESSIFVIGLGPGFTAGTNCHAVIETNRGHHLGRVLWHGSAEPDTGIPEPVSGYDVDRVLRAPASGVFMGNAKLGSLVKTGEILAMVENAPLKAPFDGALRGLLHDGLKVEAGEKVGDLDPRGEQSYCYEISDKSLAIGGGVLEALLSRSSVRTHLRG